MATPKHFAVYSIPVGGRDGKTRTDPHVAPREMRTLYIEPFRMAFQEAGALGVMSSYNDYDGEPITGSYHFLTEILRQEWGFKDMSYRTVKLWNLSPVNIKWRIHTKTE